MPITWPTSRVMRISFAHARSTPTSGRSWSVWIWKPRGRSWPPFYTAGFGRPARPPEDLLRSLVAMVLAGYTEIQDWVQLLRAEPFYAVLSGFAPDDPPGLGTFYDFQDRLCGGTPAPGVRRVKRLTAAEKRQLREEKQRPGGKPSGVVARLAQVLLRGGAKAAHWQAPAVERLVNTLLERLCIAPAVASGLLPPQVGVSGDGMKVATFANSYGKKVCACAGRGCACPRRFTDGDASTGYDAYHERYVFGHNLYQLTAWSPDGGAELPLYLLRATGRRSDAVLGPLALFRAREQGAVEIRQGCFDGAHDAAGFYQLGRAWNLPLFIPLAGAPRRHVEEEGRAPDGTPVCQAGKRMTPTGYQADRVRQQWRCPLIKGPERGDVEACPYRERCSTAPSGRVVYTYPGQDPRLHTVPPRGTPAWQAIYDHRTASERTNARQKYHLKLGRTRTRGGSRWLLRMLLAAIAQYLLAWCQHQPTT
jgi:hypothetical protein